MAQRLDASDTWPQDSTEAGASLDPKREVFMLKDPDRIAASLKHSAEVSGSRRATPFRSAMSMLVFHINRAGSDLDPEQRLVLEQAKVSLRRAFGRPSAD